MSDFKNKLANLVALANQANDLESIRNYQKSFDELVHIVEMMEHWFNYIGEKHPDYDYSQPPNNN